MLMTTDRRPTIRTMRGWAIYVLQEAGAIRECEEHGWMQERAATCWTRSATPARNASLTRRSGAERPHQPSPSTQRPSRFSTRLRALPTFLTVFFTAGADFPVFFASYCTS
jgi:hypothetical protein